MAEIRATNDWDAIQRKIITQNAGVPKNWPAGVVPVSSMGLLLFGIDPSTGKLYWNGKEILTR